MKQRWATLVAKLDVLSVRERLILFATVLSGTVALVDALWLSPAQMAHRQLVVRLDKQTTELKALRDAVRSIPRPDDANRVAREQLEQTRSQMAQVEQQILTLLPRAQDATPLARALVHLLKHAPGLTLVRTEALPPEVPGPGNNQGASQLPAGLTRQGVALTVSGNYADLTRYVDALESAMPYVRWGGMQLNADKGQTELTLQLFLIQEVTR